MSLSHVVDTKVLLKLSHDFENGIWYHFNDEKKVEEITKLISENAVPLTYDKATVDVAYLRLNLVVTKARGNEPSQTQGGAVTQPNVSAELDNVVDALFKSNPAFKLVDRKTKVSILNEWGRHSVVFELAVKVDTL